VSRQLWIAIRLEALFQLNARPMRHLPPELRRRKWLNMEVFMGREPDLIPRPYRPPLILD